MFHCSDHLIKWAVGKITQGHTIFGSSMESSQGLPFVHFRLMVMVIEMFVKIWKNGQIILYFLMPIS